MLLEATVLPSLLWGYESLDLTSKQRRSLSAVQRAMVLYMCKPPRRPNEKDEAYVPRRERIVTGIIQRCPPRKMGRITNISLLHVYGTYRQAAFIIA